MTVANSVDEIRQASRQSIHKMQIRVVCGLARRRGGSSDAGRSRAALGGRHDRSIEGTQKHSLALGKRQTRFSQTNCWRLYDCRSCYSSLFRRVSYEELDVGRRLLPLDSPPLVSKWGRPKRVNLSPTRPAASSRMGCRSKVSLRAPCVGTAQICSRRRRGLVLR